MFVEQKAMPNMFVAESWEPFILYRHVMMIIASINNLEASNYTLSTIMLNLLLKLLEKLTEM